MLSIKIKKVLFYTGLLLFIFLPTSYVLVSRPYDMGSALQLLVLGNLAVFGILPIYKHIEKKELGE
jgi:hypothetical protein